MDRVFANALLALPLAGAFSMFALGIVVIYRASRVLNLAHGAMAALPAYLAYSLSQAGMPMGVVVPLAVASGALLGVLVYRLVLRPLGSGSETTQTVGTVAVLGVLVAVIARVWGTAPLRAPAVFPEGSFDVGRSVLQVGEIGLAVIALLVAGALTTWFHRTDAGLAMRGAAENPRAAALMGVDPERTTALAWALGGALAGTAGVLLAAVTNLQPYTLSRQVLPAFVAALLGGLGSLGGALVGSLVVGLAMGVVPSLGALGEQTGSAQFVLAVIALLVMASRGERFSASGARAALARGADKARALRLRAPGWLRGGGARAGVLVALLAWPWLPLPETLQTNANVAALYTVVAVSLVVLTGWVGQISLAHASFVGIAAFATGLLTRSAGVPFPANLPIAAGLAAAVAVVLGIVALRVRGLYLAVATLIFGWMADAYLFNAEWLVGVGGSSSVGQVIVGREGAIPSFDLTDPRMFWYVALAAAAIAIVGAANLRASATGRAFSAVRGSEVAAASLGIDVTRTKLFAFAFSGVLAGIAGALMIVQGTVTPDRFEFSDSLFFLSIAVVGGLTRLGGAVAAAALFAGLDEVFFRVEALGGYLDVVSSGLLLAAVLASAPPVRAALRARLDPLLRRLPFLTTEPPPAPPLPDAAEAVTVIDVTGGPVLDADGVTVRFGGLTAAEDVSLRVDAGEIVGLIGPNGAGKTTVFNAISGLNSPAEGAIRLFGRDVTAAPPHARAALGLGRTFQIPQVFGDATVFENLLTATHLQRRTGPLQHLLVTDASAREEREARAHVAATLRLTGLEQLAHTPCASLPFGVLRMVEVARALVTGARFVMLDEPASGLDDAETEGLGALLRRARDQMGVSLLLVEHDVAFVTALSDRLYVLDRGRLIASGPPEAVRADPAVIAAYLGGAATAPVPA